MKIYKAGRTELLRNEVEQFYNENKFICNTSGIFQIHYSNAQQDFYFSKVLPNKISQQGRFYALTAEEINNILHCNVLI